MIGRLLVVLVMLSCAASVQAQFLEGFDFRETSGYVTDPADTQFVGDGTAAQDYPTTNAGVTFGWETIGLFNGRDRNSGLDPRLAGNVGKRNDESGYIVFRVDLPSAGTYEITLAAGDPAFPQTINYVLYDDSTALETYTGVSTSEEEFMDATGTVRTSAADWVANQVPKQYEFSSTILNVRLGIDGTGGGDSSTISHLMIELISSGGVSAAALRRRRGGN